MKISNKLTTTMQFNESETAAFMLLIDQVEKHRCNEGDVLKLSEREARLLADLHNYFFSGQHFAKYPDKE